MTEENKEKNFKKRFGKFYDSFYKILLLIPLIIIIFSFVYMGIFYSNNGDFIFKDFSLTGGTSITLIGKVDASLLEETLFRSLDELNTRVVYDITTGEQTSLIVQTKTNSDEAIKILESYLGYPLNDENSSVEFISATLSEDFYRQLLFAILIAFLFMAIVIFLIFRNFLPSAAVVISAFADILMTLTLVNILGIKMSSAGIVAFLMLIGYSVDTDILLTNRVLKRLDGTINEKIFSAFKTGMMMSLTSLVALAFALVVSSFFSVILAQIFTILVIGIGFDIFNTWVTNASLLKWYMTKKQK